jgi:hypothetical protein
MSPALRRRAALAALAAAALAVVATSQRRWTLTRPPLAGSATIPAGALSVERRVALRLTPPAAFAGQRVELTLAVAARATEPAAARVQAIVRAESEPWTQPDEGAAARPVAGSFAQTCAAGRPCEASFTVRWTRDPTAVGAPLTVHWALTPTARGVGDDPRGGQLSLDALP